MNQFLKNNYLNIVIAFCVIVLFTVVLSFNKKLAIVGDANDYYSYLVSLFINHNFTHQVGNDWFLIQTPTGTINLHTIGVALLMAPFFFCAFVFSKLFGFEQDGFSLPFQMGVFMAGIFYCTLGLIFIKKLLLQLHIKQNYIAFLIILVCFGTHLFNYSINEPGMPHVYAFFLTSVFLYTILNLFQKHETKYFYLSAIVFGLIILVRPVNVILLAFIPFFFQNRYDMLSKIKLILRSKHFYVSLLLLILICSIQSVAWYFQNGKFLQDSYAGNGFYFNKPQIFKMLFGFNNGLFIYIPLCFLFLFGIVSITITNKFKGFIYIVSVSLIIYVFASYWAYNYFDGFGIRTFVDFLPVFVIAGAFLFQYTVPKLKYLAIAFSFLFLIMNLIYVYQYSKGIIKGNGMDFEKYAYVFLKTNPAYADSLGGSNDLPLYSKTGSKLIFESKNMRLNQKLVNDSVYNFNDLEYGNGYDYKIKNKSNNFFVIAEFERKEIFKNSSYSAILSVSGSDSKSTSKTFQAFRLNKIPSRDCCDWKKCKFSIAVTGKFEPNDWLSVFIWNKEKAPFLIKNFNVKIFDYSYNI